MYRRFCFRSPSLVHSRGEWDGVSASKSKKHKSSLSPASYTRAKKDKKKKSGRKHSPSHKKKRKKKSRSLERVVVEDSLSQSSSSRKSRKDHSHTLKEKTKSMRSSSKHSDHTPPMYEDGSKNGSDHHLPVNDHDVEAPPLASRSHTPPLIRDDERVRGVR